MDEPLEAVQCTGCERFALLVKQKNKKIEELEKVRAFLLSCIKSGEKLSDNWEKALEDK